MVEEGLRQLADEPSASPFHPTCAQGLLEPVNHRRPAQASFAGPTPRPAGAALGEEETNGAGPRRCVRVPPRRLGLGAGGGERILHRGSNRDRP